MYPETGSSVVSLGSLKATSPITVFSRRFSSPVDQRQRSHLGCNVNVNRTPLSSRQCSLTYTTTPFTQVRSHHQVQPTTHDSAQSDRSIRVFSPPLVRHVFLICPPLLCFLRPRYVHSTDINRTASCL